jgi:chloride channel protein, CIC family
LVKIASLAVLIAAFAGVIAKILVFLIDLFTGISFYGALSAARSSPANNSLGLLVIVVPAIGGVAVGLMAFYGSKAIRGHGIPEAMEQILTNQSKISPIVTILKPLSSAISIGTGGPFGAEGPIIATGGALGSTIGQLLKITHNERKILLAAGAAAGMAAIFGSPIAAVFLAIELLLFEFSPRSIIPVSLACITGAAAHRVLFGTEPIFAMSQPILSPSVGALVLYGLIGVLIGVASILVTKIVYYVEDSFEKIPVHWMWWPAIGGLVVGIIGYFAPKTLGVGYDNIRDLLSENVTLRILLSLCFLKLASWAIALGSGTSGGTLAPLLTIGGAAGALIGMVINRFLPGSGITVPLAALVGMSAMFAGASRAVITAVIFAVETTGQSNSLLPVLASCIAAYFVSFLFMENTIMTEKIARRGVKTPHSYEPDVLEKTTVGQIITANGLILDESQTIKDARERLKNESGDSDEYVVVASEANEVRGIVRSAGILSDRSAEDMPVGSLVKDTYVSIGASETLRSAVELMAEENVDVLVVSPNEEHVIGIITYKDILPVYREGIEEKKHQHQSISLKRRGLKVLLRARSIITEVTRKGS